MRAHVLALAVTPFATSLLGPSSKPAPCGEASVEPHQLDPARLPADTQWVAHLDLDALRASELGQGLLELLHEQTRGDAGAAGEPSSDSAQDWMSEVRSQIGIDPLVDVRAVTIHGRHDGADPVYQVATTARGDAVVQHLREHEGYSVATFGEHQIHSIGDEDEPAYLVIETTAPDERLFVIGANPDSVIEQVRVLHGQAERLSDAPTKGLAARPSRSSFLFVASSIPVHEVADFEPISDISKLIRGGVLELGESEGELGLSLAVTTSSTQDARRVTAIVQGGIAVLEFALADRPAGGAITELLAGMSFTQEQADVRVSIACPGAQIRRIVHEALGN